MPENDKQAVLLIHGIGEQRPMQTLRGFVDAVWTTDKSVRHDYSVATVWSKPDTISGSFELRRLTTGKNSEGVRTDFFEFYWAHLMGGTSFSDVVAWARILLFHWPWNLPKQLRGAWGLIVGLIVVIGLFALALSTFIPADWPTVAIREWMPLVLSVAITWVAMPVIKKIIGDAARYLNPAPGNIQRRQEIRTKGVEVLQKLHEAGYKRIVVVGHSLGTVIGYDILTYAWALHNHTADKTKRHPKLDIKSHPKLDALESDLAAGKLTTDEYQVRQRELLDELIVNGLTWRVTDFLTLGSPLAHATLLLAKDADDLTAKQEAREFPTCPPVLEDGKFSYPAKRAHRTLHHAAVFGPTRWTNLYFPAKSVFWGDLIGGPLAKLFGNGVRDISVSTCQRFGLLSHTLYWTPGSDSACKSHIEKLRTAVNLLDTRPPPIAPEEPPAEEPPTAVPPADVPPADVPPADVPPAPEGK
jgi:hypothetical protein